MFTDKEMFQLKRYTHFFKPLILIASLHLHLHDHLSVFRTVLGIPVFRILASLLGEKCYLIALNSISLINNEVELLYVYITFLVIF